MHKTNTWAVILTTAGRLTRTEHRSQPEAYRKVAAELKDIENGTSSIERIRVELWDPNRGNWALYEIAYHTD